MDTNAQMKEHENLVRFTINRFFPLYKDTKNKEAIINGYSYNDLFQIGSIGLWKAIENFDAKKSSFSNYAIIKIRGEIDKEINDNYKGFHASKQIVDTVKFIKKCIKNEIPLDREFIKKKYRLSDNLYDDAYSLTFQGTVFLDAKVGENKEEIANAVTVSNEDFEIIDEFDIFNCISDKTDKLIVERLMESYTLREIGAELGISYEAVRQRREKIAFKIKEHMKSA